MQSSLVYKCPHCSTKLEVSEELIGEMVNCTNAECERPFRVEAPPAMPVSDEEGGSVIRRGGAPEAHRIDAEHVILSRHPAIFRRNLGQTITAFLLIFGGLGLMGWGIGGGGPWPGFGGLAALALGGLILLYWWLMSLYMTLKVTNKRTILRTGLFSKKTTEVEHDDVRNLQVDQSFVDRVFNIGSIAISSAGQDTLEIYAKAMPDPEGIASLIREHQD